MRLPAAIAYSAVPACECLSCQVLQKEMAASKYMLQCRQVLLHVRHRQPGESLLHFDAQSALRGGTKRMCHIRVSYEACRVLEVVSGPALFPLLSEPLVCSQQQEQRVSEALACFLQSTQGGARVSNV